MLRVTSYFCTSATSCDPDRKIKLIASDLEACADGHSWSNSIWNVSTLGLCSYGLEKPNSGIKQCHNGHHPWQNGGLKHKTSCTARSLEDTILDLEGLCLGCFKNFIQNGLGADAGLHHNSDACTLPMIKR